MMGVVRKTLTIVVGALLLFPVSVSIAQAQDVGVRLNRIENEIQTLSRALFRGETPPPPSSSTAEPIAGGATAAQQANIEIRLSQIERELAALTGRLEEQGYAVRKLQTQMEAFSVAGQPVGGSQARNMPPLSVQSAAPLVPSDFTASSGSVGGAPSQVQPQISQQTLGTLSSNAGGAVGTAASTQGADELYGQAFSLLQGREYEKAERAFSDFLLRYPAHKLTENSRYWMGETFYVRGEYERAARIFAEGYQKDPKGSKGPDNLLKLGLSLAGMGKKDDACLSFSQLLNEYAGGPNPILDRTMAERTRLGCE